MDGAPDRIGGKIGGAPVKRQRCVKIIATLGPASSDYDSINTLFAAGTDAFRINMSHAGHDGLRDLHEKIRRVETEHGRPIAILVDLQGPKLRIGRFTEGKVMLEVGQTFTLDALDEPGDETRVRVPHTQILKSLEPGHVILVDDGKIRLRAEDVSPERVITRVEIAGPLTHRKGISLPDTELPFGALSEKDRSDLEYAASLGVDWIALSFVQRPDDVAEARKIARGRAAVMAKIEKPGAVQYLREIIELSDGLMVARGDLGVEMPLEKVPGIQKFITREARRAGKPVVIATQMLETMIDSPVPTRAEVSDVATAVFEGADAIMLSAESAVGQYPVKAVETMDRVAKEVEQDVNYDAIVHAQRIEPEATSADAISAAARTVAETLRLAAIVCYTSSGATALRAARERPQQPIITLTPNIATGRKLALVWGLHCVPTSDPEDLDDMVDKACRIAFQEGFAKRGQRIIISAGVPLGTPGATNMLRIAFVGDEGL